MISIVSRDQHGNVLSSGGATLAATVTGANNATATVTDNADGTYTTRYTPTAAGTDQIAITLNGAAIGGNPYSSLVSPSAATKLGFLTQPTTVTAGQNITPAVRVAVQDANGNTVSGATDQITLTIGTNPGGGTLSGTAVANAVNGVATFANLSINRTGTGYTLAAAATGLTGDISAAFNVTPGAAAALASRPSRIRQSPARRSRRRCRWR